MADDENERLRAEIERLRAVLGACVKAWKHWAFHPRPMAIWNDVQDLDRVMTHAERVLNESVDNPPDAR